MAEATARTTLSKARYFLSQAEIHQADSTADRLPFVANLEAAIIYGRSVFDHLRNELAPIDPAYRAWHDAKWNVFKQNPVFERFSNRRNFIVHQAPEKTTVTHLASVELKVNSSVSVDTTVIRADGTVEPPGPRIKSPAKPPEPEESHHSEDTPKIFYFSDPDWRTKSAIEYVREFLDLIEPVVNEAEIRFLK